MADSSSPGTTLALGHVGLSLLGTFPTMKVGEKDTHHLSAISLGM